MMEGSLTVYAKTFLFPFPILKKPFGSVSFVLSESNPTRNSGFSSLFFSSS